jgi:hypothetical protein
MRSYAINPQSDIKVGIDRKNNEPYYDVSNSQPCCLSHNAFKSKVLSHDQMLTVVRRYQIPCGDTLAGRNLANRQRVPAGLMSLGDIAAVLKAQEDVIAHQPLPRKLKVAVLVRHNASCSFRCEGEFYRDCQCPKYLRYCKDGNPHRVAAKTRVWSIVEQRAAELQAADSPTQFATKSLQKMRAGRD